MRIEIGLEEKSKPLKVKSPCIGYCSATTLGDEVCVGCYRSFDDVVNWNKYTEHQKVEASIRSYHNYKKYKEENKDELS